MADVRTSELVINKLSKQQYENIQNPSPTELYLVPEDEEHKPICYPTTASEVKTTSMVVKSSVSDNGKILTERGFVYDTSPSPVITGNKLICDVGSGMMDGELDNLTQNTEYHIRSYGINGSGVNYGSELVQRTSFIPDEYQLVEYLESSGTQYIDTLYIPVFADNIELNIRIIGNPTQASFCGCNNGNLRCFVGYDKNANKLLIGNSNTSTWAYVSIPFDYYFHKYILNPNFVKIDNLSDVNRNTYPNLHFLLFKMNVYSQFMDISSFIITDSNNQYIRKMYPVYRKADNKPGMYDIVNGVFYTNQGTGEFTVGPDKEFDE